MKTQFITALLLSSLLGAGALGCDEFDETDDLEEQLMPEAEYDEVDAVAASVPVPVEMSEGALEDADLEAISMAEIEERCDAGDEASCGIVDDVIKAVGPDQAVECRSYHGGCTGWGGTSCAAGEGHMRCFSGAFLYAYLTICGDYGSYPSSWGTGACLW